MVQLLPGMALQEVRNRLEMEIKRGNGRSLWGARGLVRSLAESGQLKSMIDQVMSDDANLADIAARSHYHANDFLKVVLMAGNVSAWKLRLHV